jgi:chromosome segregation ATPase
MQKVEKDMQIPLPERAVQELEKIKSEELVNMAKIEAVEKFVENFSNEVNHLRPVIKKLETFERLMDLQTEISEKLEIFKEYRDHLEKSMEKNEATERSIQKEVEKIKHAEKVVNRIDETITRLSQTTEQNRKDMEDMIRPLEGKIESMSNNAKDFQDVTMSLDKRLDSMEELMKLTQNDLSVLQGNLMALENNLSGSGINDLKRMVATIDGEITAIKSMFARVDELENRIESSRASPSLDHQISDLISKLVFLESRITALEGMTQDSRFAIVVE